MALLKGFDPFIGRFIGRDPFIGRSDDSSLEPWHEEHRKAVYGKTVCTV